MKSLESLFARFTEAATNEDKPVEVNTGFDSLKKEDFNPEEILEMHCDNDEGLKLLNVSRYRKALHDKALSIVFLVNRFSVWRSTIGCRILDKPLNPLLMWYNKNHNAIITTKIENTEYALLYIIGQGSCCKVWKALNTSVFQLDAIKLIRINQASPKYEKAIKTFTNEIIKHRSLVHPNIMPLYNWEIHPNYIAISYKLCQADLTHLCSLANSPPILIKKIEILIKLASAITYLHNDAKILHLDLKPENVLLDENDEVYLADFTVFRNLHEEDDISKFTTHSFYNKNKWFGSPVYLSPILIEAMLNFSRNFKMRPCHDIYAYGCIFYKLLKHKLYICNIEDPVTDYETTFRSILNAQHTKTETIDFGIQECPKVNNLLSECCHKLLNHPNSLDECVSCLIHCKTLLTELE